MLRSVLILLPLLTVAASAVPAERPQVFVTQWIIFQSNSAQHIVAKLFLKTAKYFNTFFFTNIYRIVFSCTCWEGCSLEGSQRRQWVLLRQRYGVQPSINNKGKVFYNKGMMYNFQKVNSSTTKICMLSDLHQQREKSSTTKICCQIDGISSNLPRQTYVVRSSTTNCQNSHDKGMSSNLPRQTHVVKTALRNPLQFLKIVDKVTCQIFFQ